MEPGEALGIAAQIAVALAGFAGVVVAFRSGSLHEWSLVDKYRLWFLLGNALLPLFACLFGMLLLTIKPTPLFIWHWCSGFSFLLIFCFGFLSHARRRGLILISPLPEMWSFPLTARDALRVWVDMREREVIVFITRRTCFLGSEVRGRIYPRR